MCLSCTVIYLRRRKRYMFSPARPSSSVCLSRQSVCLSVCVQDYSKTRAWISMKCCVSTDVGTWTNWLTFEPDPDHSPDPGAGFTPDFWILAGYLNKLWTDFDEILWVDSHGGLGELAMFWAGSGLQSGSRIRIYTVFLNFNGISEEVMDKFWWNLIGR